MSQMIPFAFGPFHTISYFLLCPYPQSVEKPRSKHFALASNPWNNTQEVIDIP